MCSNIIIRCETKDDRRSCEELTREAFWNKYHPGCSEHYVLHKFREDPAFVPELSCVITLDGVVIAHIMYCRAAIKLEGGGLREVMMFGPVSVMPKYQGQGYGSAIIRYTLDKARDMGCGAVAITGNPAYYHRFGFVSGSSLGVRYEYAPEGDEAPYFMIAELVKGYLDGVKGTFREPECYNPAPEELEKFDSTFPKKIKLKLPGQLE